MRPDLRTRASVLRGSARRTAAGGVLIAAALVAAAGVAAAQFASTASAASPNSTAVLAAPTAPAASVGACTAGTTVTVKVTWTATTSSWADGDEILRSITSGGPYTTAGTVSGAATSSFIDSGVTFGTTYYYVVRATKGAWRSASTAQVSVTTPSPLCV